MHKQCTCFSLRALDTSEYCSESLSSGDHSFLKQVTTTFSGTGVGNVSYNLSPFSQTLLSSSVHRFAWPANSASLWHVPFAAGDAASLSPPPLAPSELASAAAAAL